MDKIVRAQKGAYYSFGMSCPTCGEPVHLKQGPMRRAHFAHYSNRAKPDCELYHPPSDVINRYRSQGISKRNSLLPKRDSLLCGLFLSHRQDPSEFELSIRIPSLPLNLDLSGSLHLQHKLGLKELAVSQLAKVQNLKVEPSVPLLECAAEEDLLPLSDHINEQISLFGSSMNVFFVSENRGRILFKDEPLEWGGKYWIASEDYISLGEEILAHTEWILRGSLSGWKVYELGLPSTFSSKTFDYIKNIITEFFSRNIRTRRPRAHIVYPLPHHIGDDGAYVYPRSPGTLLLRKTSTKELSVEGPSAVIESVSYQVISEELTLIQGLQLSDRDTTILIGGVEQVIVRVEECELIKPEGIEAESNGLRWSLVSDSKLDQNQLYAQEVKITCGNNRLVKYLEKKNVGLEFEGKTLTLPSNSKKTFLAGAFGEIGQVKSEAHYLPPISVANKESVSSQEKWIINLVRSRYGSHKANLVSNYFSNPIQSNLQKLGDIVTSPLMPYILNSSKANRQS